MKKMLTAVLAALMLLGLCACSVTIDVQPAGPAAPAASDSYAVTLINGMDGRLAPTQGATRAQIATILARYIGNAGA